jgi:hypothetical protein
MDSMPPTFTLRRLLGLAAIALVVAGVGYLRFAA